jgi:RND family efflux transporter MFP subunit
MAYPKNSSKRLHLFLSRSPAVLLVCMAMTLAGCDEAVHDMSQPRQVRTWVASQQPLPVSSWTGIIEPAAEVSLQFRLDGWLATRPVDVGSRVKMGQVVATLSGSQSKEDMAATLAEYQEALAAEHKGRLELERIQKLYTIGTASRAQLEDARATMATLTARKVRAQAQKSGALNESGFSSLTSPFDGVITQYKPSVGQNVTAGQDVIKIASDTAEVQFSVPVQTSSRLHTGDTVLVNTEQGDVNAHVRYISPTLDDITRTSLVRATLETTDAKNVFGRAVTVGLKTSDKLYFPVPASSLTRSGNHPAIFVVKPGTSNLELRSVVIERYTSDKAWVSSGLTQGERVVSAGTNTLENGEKVAVVSGETK